ncbi:MAG: pilus assembly protein N-terminal domain-containing protein, partial [Algiphilus sp.]
MPCQTIQAPSVHSKGTSMMNRLSFTPLLLAGLLYLASVSALQAADVHYRSGFEVENGTHELLRRERAVVRVAVGDPEIAAVNVINRKELLVTGRKLGETSLLIWPEGNREPERLLLRVVPIASAQGAPDAELAGAAIRPGVGLSGPLPNVLAHRRARAQAGQGMEEDALNDTSRVTLETQVLTELTIAEVSRRTAQRYGFNFSRGIGDTTASIVTPGGLNGVSNTPNGFALDSGFVPLSNAFNLVLGDAANNVLGVLSVLESKGMARTLAEPSLTATSGQTASFLAGGEFPVPVSQGGATAGGITVEFKEFGVRLNLTPTVLSKDRIALKVAPEVSELDFTAGIQISGTSVPALVTRRTDTSVELGNGESFVISGLVSST